MASTSIGEIHVKLDLSEFDAAVRKLGDVNKLGDDFLTAYCNSLIVALPASTFKGYWDVMQQQTVVKCKTFDPSTVQGLGDMALYSVYAAIEAEIGLPRCDELMLHVYDDYATRAYRFEIDWPGDYRTFHLIDRHALTLLRDERMQLKLICDTARKMAREWVTAMNNKSSGD